MSERVASAFLYEECDIPSGMTIDRYRAQRAALRRPRRLAALREWKARRRSEKTPMR